MTRQAAAAKPIRKPRQHSQTCKYRQQALSVVSRDLIPVIDEIGVVSISDTSGRIVYANRKFLDISGYSMKDLSGKDHRIVNSGHHTAEFFDTMHQELAQHRVWRSPIKNRAKGGSNYWLDLTVIPLKNREGFACGFLSIGLDITISVNTHQELRSRDRLLQDLLDSFPGGIAIFDRSLQMVVCNEKQKELLEYPEHLFADGLPTFEDLLRFNAQRGEYGDGDVENQVQHRLSLARLNQPHTYERVRPNGVYVEVRGAPLSDGGFLSTHIDVTDRKRDQATITMLAHHDTLTGLANRRLLRDRLQVALARVQRGDMLALHLLDLDRFKAVNDTLGHPAGDALLQAVGERLRKTTRAMDTVARLGGDEFAILQIAPKSVSDAVSLAQRIIRELSAPFELGKHTVSIGTSIGIALAPSDAVDPDQLLKNADLALYQVKDEGRGTYHLFEKEMDERVKRRSQIESGLRRSLDVGEFELHYQPIVSTVDRKVISCEALLRWYHPERGLVPASEFVPIAEESGLIGPIGEWVLKQACSEARNFPKHISVAVNVSVAQFRRGDLCTAVINSLNGLDPSRLILEITESTLMQNDKATIEMLQRVRALGVRFALDDFGTGYSSLGYLQSFPFDKLKIDRSFISSTARRSKTLLSAIASLGRALDMTTVAEGIETEEQFTSIKAQGCCEAQGYLFSRAVPAKQIERFF